MGGCLPFYNLYLVSLVKLCSTHLCSMCSTHHMTCDTCHILSLVTSRPGWHICTISPCGEMSSLSSSCEPRSPHHMPHLVTFHISRITNILFNVTQSYDHMSHMFSATQYVITLLQLRASVSDWRRLSAAPESAAAVDSPQLQLHRIVLSLTYLSR